MRVGTRDLTRSRSWRLANALHAAAGALWEQAVAADDLSQRMSLLDARNALRELLDGVREDLEDEGRLGLEAEEKVAW